MEAHERSFTFMGTASYYDIPFFQRAYVWDEENWQELLANFLDQTDSHFLGSIILKQEKLISGSYPRYMIIDGQQRLTTLSILTRACFDRLIEDKDAYEESVVNDFKQELRTLLFIKPNKFSSEEEVKIQHSKLDAPAFQDVIKGKYADCISDGKWSDKYKKEESRIVRCYLFFRKELHARSVEDVHKIWNLMTEEYPRYLVNIDLDANENEQKIFDTVNSFGVRLSSSDTIKNSVFQSYIDALRKDNQPDIRNRATSLYEKTWEKAFEADEDIKRYWETTRRYGRMTRDNLEVFLNSFAVIMGFFDPAVDNIVSLPQKYKAKVAAMDWKEIEKFLELISKYADVFQLYFSNFDSDTLLSYNEYRTRLLHICHALDVATFYPYILKLLYENAVANSLSEDDLKDKFMQLERYIVMNAICGGSSKNYNNECVQLVRERKAPEDLRKASNYISKHSFEDGLLSLKLNKLPTVLLFWVELFNRGNNEYADIKDLKYDYTLEHIMPQKWQKNWSVETVPVVDAEGNKVEDKDKAESMRAAAVYEIGNMTLLNSKLNTAVSNGDFQTKLNGDGKKYKHCMKNLADLYLTREVVNEKEWNEQKIYERTERLTDGIKKVWNIEFEEDKPVHLEIDENDIDGSYVKIFEGKNFIESADLIYRSDLSDGIKNRLMVLQYEDFSAWNIEGRIRYGSKKSIFDNDTYEMLCNIGDYAYGDFVSTLLAVDDMDEEGTLDAVKRSIDAYINDNPDHVFNEDEFYVCAFNLVKDRFPDFYIRLGGYLNTINCDPLIIGLCGVLDEFYRLKNDKDRITCLIPVSEKHPDSNIVNSLLAWCYYGTKDWKTAITHFERTLAEGSWSIFYRADIYFWLAYAYGTIRDGDNSIKYYLKVLEINPNSENSLNNIGYEYYKKHDYEKALDYYNRCIEKYPEDVYAVNNKVSALIKMNRLEELKEYISNPPIKLRKSTIDKAKRAINGLGDEDSLDSTEDNGNEDQNVNTSDNE